MIVAALASLVASAATPVASASAATAVQPVQLFGPGAEPAASGLPPVAAWAVSPAWLVLWFSLIAVGVALIALTVLAAWWARLDRTERAFQVIAFRAGLGPAGRRAVRRLAERLAGGAGAGAGAAQGTPAVVLMLSPGLFDRAAANVGPESGRAAMRERAAIGRVRRRLFG